MIVYADVLFFINFFMNYLIISVCGAIVPAHLKNRRKLLASTLGGIYGVCVFIPDLTFMYSVLSVFLFSAAIVAVVFCPCKIKDFLRYLAVFYISSFILAGGIYMLLPYIGGGVIRNNVVYYESFGVIGAAIIIFFAAVKIIRRIKINAKRKEYKITIKYKEKTVSAEGMLDTGNMLSDPLTGKPVIVGDETVLKTLFSEECNVFNLSEWIESTDMRIIPYKTMDGEGVMTGFVPEEICIDGKVIKDVIVAVSPKKLEHGILINSGVL